MASRSAHEHVKTLAQYVDTPSGNTAVNTGAADTRGFRSVQCFVVVQGTATPFTGTNDLTVGIQHSDSETAGWADVPEADILAEGSDVANGTVTVLDGAHENARSYRFGYRGTKRYVRVRLTRGHNNTPSVAMSAVVVGMNPLSVPTAEEVF